MRIPLPSWEARTTVLGIILIVLGLVFRDLKVFNASIGNIGDGLGAAVFLGGIYFYMERMTTTLSSHGTGISTIDKMISDHKRFEDVGYLIRRIQSAGDKLVLVCSASLLERMSYSYILKLADQLADVSASETDILEIRDFSPIGILVEELAAKLPNGSVWFGLSRLQSPDAWSGDDGPTIKWNQELLSRAGANSRKKMTICRLWAFDSEDAFRALGKEMQRQKDAGVIVRYLKGDKFEEMKKYINDVSLTFVPNTAERLRDDAIAQNPDRVFNGGRYKALHALEFSIKGGVYLELVRILSTDDTASRIRDYLLCWQAATPY